MPLSRESVTSEVEAALDKLFGRLDYQAQVQGLKPSELGTWLDQAAWGLGDDYREWFEEGNETYE